MLTLLKKLGFEPHYSVNNQSSSYVHLESGVHCTTSFLEDTYKFSGGDIKFFGNIEWPIMSSKRPEEDIIKQFEVAKFYIALTKNNSPW